MTWTNLTSRERLLEVIRILQDYTDDNEMMTIHDIHGFFREDSKVGIRAVRDDVLSLEDSNVFPVAAVQEKNGLTKQYHYDGRLFEIHELRLLMDAISAAKFIPKKETERLLMKIRKLTSRRLAKQLKNELYVAEEMKQGMVEITSSVQLLHKSVEEHRVVAFQYGRYGADLQFQLSNEGNEYYVKPYGLVWNKDKYYLIGNYEPEDEVRQYRVDRMRNTRITNDKFVPDSYFHLNDYLSKMFHMFSGDKISLEVEFSHKLLNVVIDRFGTGANIQDMKDGTFILKSQADMSKGLLRWLLGWGSEARVLHPDKLVLQVKEEVEKLHKRYY